MFSFSHDDEDVSVDESAQGQSQSMISNTEVRRINEWKDRKKKELKFSTFRLRHLVMSASTCEWRVDFFFGGRKNFIVCSSPQNLKRII